jgi:hypothetical protein
MNSKLFKTLNDIKCLNSNALYLYTSPEQEIAN